LFDFAVIWSEDVSWFRRGCGIVEFVGWYIVDLVIKAQNDWHDVGQFQVAMHRNAVFPSSYCFSIGWVI